MLHYKANIDKISFSQSKQVLCSFVFKTVKTNFPVNISLWYKSYYSQNLYELFIFHLKMPTYFLHVTWSIFKVNMNVEVLDECG